MGERTNASTKMYLLLTIHYSLLTTCLNGSQQHISIKVSETFG